MSKRSNKSKAAKLETELVPGEEAAPKAAKAQTGTARVLDDKRKVRIPDPQLPAAEKEVSAKEAKAREAKAKPAPPPYVVVPASHLVATLGTATDQNRLSRLKDLSRRNRDVAWLLDKFSSPKHSKPTQRRD